MTTHAIILGGILKDQTGRPLGPYRLRTALANHGFRAEVVDYAWALREDELLILLQRYISKDTLILGISNIWFTTNTEKNNAELNRWFTAKFFQIVKKGRLLFYIFVLDFCGLFSKKPFSKKPLQRF